MLLRQNQSNVAVWSRGRFIAGPFKETGDLCSKTLNSLIVCGRFYRQILGWGLQVRLSSWWWWGNRWCSRNLVLSLKLLPSIRVGALVPAELKDIVMYISWGTRTLLQGCTLVSWLLLLCLCLSSVPCISTSLYLPLEAKGRSWKLRFIPKKWGTGRLLFPGASQNSARFWHYP